MTRHDHPIEKLRTPPESGTRGARRGLMIRDSLFGAAYACLAIAADVVQHPLAWLGFLLLLLRTYLKPSREWWRRNNQRA